MPAINFAHAHLFTPSSIQMKRKYVGVCLFVCVVDWGPTPYYDCQTAKQSVQGPGNMYSVQI